MINFDVIILSKGSTENLREYTSKCIESLLKSEDPRYINFNIVVLESEEGVYYDYEKTQTIYTVDILGEFNYAKSCNHGVKITNSEYVALCNNDIMFESGWASAIVKTAEAHPDILSFGTVCPEIQQNINHREPFQEGYTIREYVTGWCIVHKRDIYSTIGEYSEDFKFWYFDNYYADLLQSNNIRHVRVNRSFVHHHNNSIGKTAELLPEDDIQDLTHKQTEVFQNYLKHKMKPEKYKHTLNNFFDEIFVINLTKDSNRYQDSLKVYDYLDIKVTRWNATPNLIFNDYVKLLGNPNLNGNYIACLNSHLTAIEHAYTKGHQRILIIEDDIVPIKDLNKRFNNVINELPPTWDMLYLSYIRTDDSKNIWTYVGLEDDKISENVVKAKNFWSGMGYALNRGMMERVLNYYKSNIPIEIDRFFVEMVQPNPLFNCYGSVPQLFAGVDNYSNNTNLNESIFDRSINSVYVSRGDYYQPDETKNVHVNEIIGNLNYVNSKWDSDSYNHMKKQFEHYGIEYKRYDKIEDNLYFKNITEDEKFDSHFIISKPGYNSDDAFYYLSHFNVMHNNHTGNVGYIQDRVEFIPGFNHHFSEYIKSVDKFDICMLGCDIVGNDYIDKGNHVIVSNSSGVLKGFNGYIISKEFLPEYLNILESYKYKAIDIETLFQKVLQGLHIIIVAPKKKLIYVE